MSEIYKLAICGKLRSGKTSTASQITFRYGFDRVSFGTSLKRIADDLFDGSSVYPLEYYEVGTPCPFDGERAKSKRKPRRLYQDFGEAVRKLDPYVWIRQAERMVEYYSNMRDTQGIIIDDLRNVEEFNWCKANGFTVIRVNANEDTRIARAESLGDSFNLESLRHETEQSVDDFEVDYNIWNDGDDTEELRRQVDDIMAEIIP